MPRYKIVNGNRVQLTDSEEAARNAEELDWANGANARAAAAVRKERNEKLAATDWMASSDLSLTTSWRDYRAALRAVPQQGSFPSSVSWPWSQVDGQADSCISP